MVKKGDRVAHPELETAPPQAVVESATPPASNGEPAPAVVVESAKRDKAAKWRQLANARLKKYKAVMGQLCNIANRANYSYTDEQVEMLLFVVDEWRKRLEHSFEGNTLHDDSDNVF